ncbi:hypothetical protein HGB25_00455 [Candidatus Saccharibacteria bacterium]|nr:hypothetical protein [Candidatus Saccharibacteria bacterium]
MNLDIRNIGVKKIAIGLFVFLAIITVVIIIVNIPVDNSTISKDHYYADKSLDNKYVGPSKLAVESFVNQDASEPADTRTGRLKKYFTDNSKVYGYELDNLSPNIDKARAKMTSIMKNGVDDASVSVSVIVYVDYFAKGKPYFSDTRTYVLSFSTDSKDSVIKPYDIEEQL